MVPVSSRPPSVSAGALSASVLPLSAGALSAAVLPLFQVLCEERLS